MAPELHPSRTPTQTPLTDDSLKAVLEVGGLHAGYGRREVLSDVSLSVGVGEIVCVLGHNGAGKSTLLKTIFGMVKPTSGSIMMEGRDVAGHSPAANVRQGISFTPAEAAVFPELSVEQNLQMGAFSVPDPKTRQARTDEVYELFPILRRRRAQAAGTLCGGQQRMLSIGMALVAGPKLMLLDEPSLGIAPSIGQELFALIRTLADTTSIAVLLVEQNVRAALRAADRAYFIRSGRILLEESAEAAQGREHWWDLF